MLCFSKTRLTSTSTHEPHAKPKTPSERKAARETPPLFARNLIFYATAQSQSPTLTGRVNKPGSSRSSVANRANNAVFTSILISRQTNFPNVRKGPAPFPVPHQFETIIFNSGLFRSARFMMFYSNKSASLLSSPGLVDRQPNNRAREFVFVAPRAKKASTRRSVKRRRPWILLNFLTYKFIAFHGYVSLHILCVSFFGGTVEKLFFIKFWKIKF